MSGMYKASSCVLFTEKGQIPVGRIQQGSDEDPGEVLHPDFVWQEKGKVCSG